MKQKAINYEVLLFTNTRFSKKEFSEKNFDRVNMPDSCQLQNACWNGLVFEILPDIIQPASAKNPVYTWEVAAAENFIEVKIGTAPYSIEGATSLNPYLLLSKKNFN